MKNNKLWATGLSALFLSTTILSGAPSIVSGQHNVAQAATTPEEDAKAALATEISRPVNGDGSSPALNTAYGTALANAVKVRDNKDATVVEMKEATSALHKAIEDLILDNQKTLLSDLIKKELVTTDKPVALVKEYADAKKVAQAALSADKLSLATLTDAYNDLKKSYDKVFNASKVYTYDLGTDKSKKIEMYDAAGNFISSSIIKADTQTIEIADVKDLTKYGLDVKSGFVLTSSGLPANNTAVEKLTVAQKSDATFTNVKVRVNFLKDGVPYSVAEVKSTDFVSGIAGTTYSAKAIVEKFISGADQEAVERDYLTDGYTYEDKKYTLDASKYIQEITVNIVKEAPKAPSVRMPSKSSFNGYFFKAGSKYSLSNQLELFYNENGELNEANYKIEPLTAYRNSDPSKRNLIVTKPDGKKYVVFPKANVNYTVKFKVTPKDGYKFHDSSKNILSDTSVTFSNTAYANDSAPVIKGITTSTFAKGTFTKADYMKGISAFDFVDNKAVAVRHSSPVKASVPGTYKVVYKATDSKGFTAKKTRTITIK